MKRIDCHVHPFLSIERTLADAAQAEIQRQCVFGIGYDRDAVKPSDFTHPKPEAVSASNNLVREMISAHPDRISGLCFINPRERSHAIEEVTRCVLSGPFVGIKLWIARRVTHPDVLALAEFAQTNRVPILAHCWNKVGGNVDGESSTSDIAELARLFPRLTILAAHVTGQAERGVIEIAPYENVVVDTSGGDAEVGICEFALSTLGARRILFGSDYPTRAYPSSLARVLGCTGDEEALSCILHRNFERLFLEPKGVLHD